MKEFDSDKGKKWVAGWIITGVVMLLIQVVLGGVTRLTGSGLSITEWNVVTGTLPPLNENAWMAEFSKYQQTPLIQVIEYQFYLDDFKFIFFWEWFHRFWARLIGIVFLVGFVFLVSKKYLKKEMHQPLMLLFLMGAMQGAIGWIMVASGLTGDAIYVKPTRLALHFIFAIGLIAYAWWFALQLTVDKSQVSVDAKGRNKVWVLIVLTGIQLIFGALMAGHKAATAAPTWPDINGSLLPDHAFSSNPFIRDIIENKITIHFIHRTLAYVLLLLITWFGFNVIKNGKTAGVRKHARYPLVFVWLQVLLGIFAVLLSTGIVPNQWGSFEWMAQLHQVVGMLLLLSLVSMLYFHRKRPLTH